MNTWLKKFHEKPAFIHSTEALIGLQSARWPEVKQTAPLAMALMNRYAHPQTPHQDKAQLYRLMLVAARRGLNANSLCNGKPFYILAHQFRLQNLLPLLTLPNHPSLQSEVLLKGFLGALVKMGVNNLTEGQELDSLIAKRNSPYQMRKELNHLRKQQSERADRNVYFKDFITAINASPKPPRPIEISHGYHIRAGKTLPKVKQHLIHAAVANYNLPLLKTLIERGVKVAIWDHFGRNILHLAHIVGASKIIEFISSLPENVQHTLNIRKDVFGKTPAEIATWKQEWRSVNTAEKKKENGGWNPFIEKKLETNRMEIDQVHISEINRNQFLKEHLSCLKPVLIKEALSPDHRLTKRCRKSSFYQHFSQTNVAAGSIPYAKTFHKPERFGPLKSIPKGKDNYIFSQLSQQRDRALISEFNCIDITKKLENLNWQFYHGPAESGAPVHFHGDAWNLLVHGRKRWLIYSPMDGFYSTQPSSELLKSTYPKAMEFTQEAGDLIYIPRYWAHGVVNLQECIGVATEFNSPYII